MDTSAVLRYLDGEIPYADCFGIELALDPPARILLTADFDVKPAADAVHIEFLPVK